VRSSLGGFPALKLRDDDGYIYVFGSIPGGLALARVLEIHVVARSQYEHYQLDTASCTSVQPSPKDESINILASAANINRGFDGSGDIFWSERHGTYLMIYMTDLDITLRVRRALDHT